MFLLAQIFGILASFASILCVQASSSAGVLLGQILSNCCSGLSYGLLGSFSGAWVCILAAVHSTLITLIRKKDPDSQKKWIPVISVVFALCYIGGTVVTFTRWTDIISCVCALLFVVTIAQENASEIKILERLKHWWKKKYK